MAKVFMSFLGRGSFNQNTKQYEYTPSSYSLNESFSQETPFVQVAELELLKPLRYDKILIVTTEIAADKYFERIKESLYDIGYSEIKKIILSEDMSTQGQWHWFEQILSEIEDDDSLSVDLTHGYRSIPIIFSTAINFLQWAKNIKIDHVFYGAFDKNRETVPIIEMKEFYSINMWANAIERLVEDADARKIAELSNNVPEYQISELNNPCIINALMDLSNRIKNTDINYVNNSSVDVINNIRKIEDATPIERLLFNAIEKKYSVLGECYDLSGKYDKNYFEMQLELIKLYNEHKLYMQSFTSMRELIGSIGLIEIPNARYDNDNGRKLRRKYLDHSHVYYHLHYIAYLIYLNNTILLL